MALDVSDIPSLLQRYGYLLVFIAAVAEALPFLGWLVPGQAIIILAGAAAAAGYLNLWVIIAIAIPAGIVGDALGYYIGRRYGRAFLEKYGPRFRITPRHLERSDRLFSKYGPFALVIARFSFLTRAVGPVLAGMARMPGSVFWPINVLGALAWAGAYALMGYFFGISFLYLQGVVGKILAFTALAVIGLYVFYRVLRKYADQFTRDDFYVALLGSVSGATFGILADRVQKAGAANVLDAHQPELVELLAPLAPFFRVVETLTSLPVLGGVAILAFAILVARRRTWDAALVGLGMGGVILLVASLRPAFLAALPAGPGDSFPSASAAVPLVLAGVATYLVASASHRQRGPLVTALVGAAFAGLALLSRLAQGAEYPSAVLAGLALGAAWLSVSILVVEFRLKRNPRKPALP